MKKGLCAALVALPLLVWSGNASGYLTSSAQLLDNLADRRGNLKLQDVSAQLTADIEGIDSPVEERIFIKSPERLRLVQETPDGTRLYIEREGRRAEGSESSLKSLSGPSTGMLAALLMPRGSTPGEKVNRLLSLLKSVGINTRSVNLGIYGDDVRESAFIIGAKAWESDKAQLWIDRESYQPVRLVIYDESGGERVRYESRYLGYGSPAGGVWFPETIENYRNGELVRRSRLNEVRTNENLPESMFRLP